MTLWFVVIRPLGPHLSYLPGDLADTRLIQYLLEHNYRWTVGSERSFWNAPFFYPYPNTITFSDNLLGAAPFYSLLRMGGFDRETAFQLWYILGYCFNFAAASIVLSKMKFSPLAVGLGAYFFTFGLPVLGQETHPQLLYRFGVPPAVYLLWRFFKNPQLWTLAGVFFWTAWQGSICLYTGFFLFLILSGEAVLLPLGQFPKKISESLAAWPNRLTHAWGRARWLERIGALTILLGLVMGVGLLALKYDTVLTRYGFQRTWIETTTMLPRLQSYLRADRSILYGWIARLLPPLPSVVHHQLFPGLAVCFLTAAGLMGRFRSEQRTVALASLGAAGIGMALTLYVDSFSLYHLLWPLPVFRHMRALSMLWLVSMWPLALFLAYTVDGLLRSAGRLAVIARWFALMGGLLLVIEPVFFQHQAISKVEAQLRLEAVKRQIPAEIPDDPILYVSKKPVDQNAEVQLDAMLVAQESGWSTINGYSGHFPSKVHVELDCSEIRPYLQEYLQFMPPSDPADIDRWIKRLVPVGFGQCSLER